ncbi:conserved unknown protein [Ectocarpus siliculosus]|uniref:KIF-binding protein n=1 Tax=Ectocarpus siliculosus TaxID=2880 RepID=D7FI61_ECTSI|nr:conserved unknown protein [Ectocarpus siliculosus]|eukprot:CBJ28687.1 conserved unknown protein [Ectocarpus siliculosus]
MDGGASVGDMLPQCQHAPAFEDTRESEDEVKTLMEISRKLCLVEDPPAEPFRSKYKAREALQKARQNLVGQLGQQHGGAGGAEEVTSAAAAAAAGRVAVIDYRLGVIALAVEENSAAQEALDKCADAFFEGVVSKIAAAAGNEEDESHDDLAKDADSPPPPPPPPPIPTEPPAGMVSPCPLAWECPEEAADTLTQLGLLWSARGYPRRSLLYLLASVGFLRQASSSPPPPSAPVPPSTAPARDEAREGENEGGNGNDEGEAVAAGCDGGAGSGDNPTAAEAAAEGSGEGGDSGGDGVGEEEEKRGKLESMLTHVFYYLAQAYGVRDVEQSAKYCALTLQRQLDASQRGDGVKVSFDPGEWSRNACFLADYYSGLGRFTGAGRCLLAAQAVLQPEGSAAAVPTGGKDNASLPPPPPARGKDEGEEKGEDGGNAKSGGDSGGATRAGGGGRETEKVSTANERKREEEEGTEEERERRREQRADVDRHMAKLYITVLQAKHLELGRGGGAGGEFCKVRTREEEEEEEGLVAGFASLGIGELPMCDPAGVPGDFESVRDVFKRAKSHTERALRHYVLDGFVTAHVALHQGLSRAYLYLSGFERDAKRRQAMCTRRAQALEPLLDALARKAYARLHKELSFELGEIYQDLADIKTLRAEEKLKSGGTRAPTALASDLRGANKLLKSAIGFFSHFVAMYHEGDPSGGSAESPSQPAKGMEPDEAVGYLQARFMRARLNGKLRPLTSEKELHALRVSCGEFAWLSEHARGHLKSVRETAGDPGIFEQELELAEEMAQLQRRNIANLEQKLEEKKKIQAK